TNTFIWTISNGICPATKDTVTIFNYDMPTVSLAGTDQTICSTASVLNANLPTVGTGNWSVFSGTGSVTSSLLQNSSVTSLSVGANTFIWTISNGVCPVSNDTVTIFRDNFPSASNAGGDQTICSGTSTLNALIPTTGTGIWSLVSGPAIITSPLVNTSGVTTLNVGNNLFVWTVSNGTCASSKDTVNILVFANPSGANAGADQNICLNSSALNATIPVVGTGSWNVFSGGGTVTSPSLNNSNITGLSYGQNILTWTVSNGVCPPTTDTVKIQAFAFPSVPDAGTDQVICNSTSALNAVAPTIGTGLWTVGSGTGNVSSPLLINSAVTNLNTGNNSFVWTVTNGVCPPVSDTLNIQVDVNPTSANAGNNSVICSATATLNGNIPVNGTGNWTVFSGGGIVSSPSQNNSGITNLNLGTNIVVWTISNGVCPPSSDSSTIFVDANPSAPNAGSDQNICASASTLTATLPVTGTGSWSLFSGTGIINSVNQNTSAVSNLGTGINSFIWTVVNGVCPAVTDTVSIKVDALPSVANAGSDQGICAASLNLSGNNPTSGSGVWTLLSGTGVIFTANSNTSLVTGLTQGINSFVWTIGNGVCPSNSDTVVITYYGAPDVAIASADFSVCEPDSFIISGNSPLNGSGAWSIVLGGGTISSAISDTTFITNPVYGTTIFRWTITNGPCPSSSDDITVTVHQAPSVSNAGADQVLFFESSILAATAPLVGTGDWSVLSGSGFFSNNASPTASVNGLTIGQNLLLWTVINGTCPASVDTVSIERESAVIPDAFSPNGDNTNDYFEIKGIEYYGKIKITVYNRWGDVVFAKENYHNEWGGESADGKQLTDDTYYFLLETEAGKEIKGFVVLKR
ncbi:MAG: gliding motility-associated C-terminal domain-containing protein, partial [Bacteroidia bacterium]|nr:gliding motility-associated C-terminal domain-containing protein [Bacteroidia bacterium]